MSSKCSTTLKTLPKKMQTTIKTWCRVWIFRQHKTKHTHDLSHIVRSNRTACRSAAAFMVEGKITSHAAPWRDLQDGLPCGWKLAHILGGNNCILGCKTNSTFAPLGEEGKEVQRYPVARKARSAQHCNALG